MAYSGFGSSLPPNTRQPQIIELTLYQRKALGMKKKEQIEEFIWNPKVSRLYQQIDETNMNLGDEGQTYPDFLKMEKRPPNQSGTGRYKFTEKNNINIIFIPKKGNNQPSHKVKQQISQFLETYLNIPCQPEPLIKMQTDGKNLINKSTNIAYSIRFWKKMFDVHDILEVLLEYHTEKTILVAFLEHQIHENRTAIDGRAYGDGVTAVYYSSKDLEKNLEGYLQTLVHETLHTLGFDHCLAWKCLMNGYTNFQSWLCPVCSKKLYHELQLNSTQKVIGWMGRIIGISEQLKVKKTLKKGVKLMKAIQSIIN